MLTLRDRKQLSLEQHEAIDYTKCTSAIQMLRKWLAAKAKHKPTVGQRVVSRALGLSSGSIACMIWQDKIPPTQIVPLAELMQLSRKEVELFSALNEVSKMDLTIRLQKAVAREIVRQLNIPKPIKKKGWSKKGLAV